MDEYENMCQVITSGYCPYADGFDEDVKSCADCPWHNPEAEQRFFEEMKQDGRQKEGYRRAEEM